MSEPLLQPRIVQRQRAAVAPLPPEVEHLAQQLRQLPPQQRQSLFDQMIGDPGTDSQLYDAAALSRNVGVLPPWHRDKNGGPPLARGADVSDGRMMPMDREEDPTGFTEGLHDPWRGKRRSLFD